MLPADGIVRFWKGTRVEDVGGAERMLLYIFIFYL